MKQEKGQQIWFRSFLQEGQKILKDLGSDYHISEICTSDSIVYSPNTVNYRGEA